MAPSATQATVAATPPAPVEPARVAAIPSASALPLAAQPAPSADIAQALASLQGELARRFDGLMWGHQLKRSPQRTLLLRELLEAGFSIALARELLCNCPDAVDSHAMRQWLRQQLIARLQTQAGTAEQPELLAQRGIYALVGPTGVGKTTTVAKLAARCIELHGRENLALVSTDSFRIAAHEQLQTFGRLMGVPVFTMRSDADLRELLHSLSDKAVVLIDNIGLSQRDSNVARQLTLLAQTGLPVQRVLVLNAASQGDTLEEVACVYRSSQLAAGVETVPLQGCIITKLDEAAHTGNVLDTAIRHGLAVHYVTDGQKVPENLRIAVAAELIDQALARQATTTALYVPDEAGLAALTEAASPAFSPQVAAPGSLAPTAAALRSWLPWLLQRSDESAAPALLNNFEAGLAWSDSDLATRLAREAWRQWSQPGPASSAAPHLLADQWSKAAQDICIGLDATLLVVHGKVSLTPHLPRAALAGALLASDRGQLLCSPAQTLISPFGLYSIVASQESSPQELPLQQLRWLERELPRSRRLHLFDSLPSNLWPALQQCTADWLALGSNTLKARALDAPQDQTGYDSLKSLASEVVLSPLALERQSVSADDEAAHWWLGQLPVRLKPAAAAGADSAAGLRLLVLRRTAAKPDSDAVATVLLLSNVPESRASASRLALCYLNAQRLRSAFRYMAPAWSALGAGGDEDGIWQRRALLAGQVGVAAWQVAHAHSAAPLRELLAASSGRPRPPAAKPAVDALLRSFALMELASAR
jgi:flagellar biosynthesis protein FlhF